MSDSRILIIEDEEYLRDLYSEILSDYIVESVKDGFDALEKETKYDLYIVDIGLPGMDGLKTIEKLKDIYGNNIKTIVVTGYDIIKYTKRLKRCNPNMVLHKPFKISDFVEAVDTVLNSKG